MTSSFGFVMGVMGCVGIGLGVLLTVFGGPSLGSIQAFVIGYGLLILVELMEKSND
jgi:hypothetical protein